MKHRKRGRRKKCAVNVAWLRLSAGTLRVDLDTSEVYSFSNGTWALLKFYETKKREPHKGGYFSTKLQITIDGVKHRQHCFLHRIVWMAKYGQELKPEDEVDHGDAGKKCNHWSNLDKVTGEENLRRARERDGVAEYAETF